MYVIWKFLGLPEPTPVQYDMAYFLQHGPRRKVLEAFRGVGKSWITSAYVCWLLYCNPQTKILVVSASKIRADDFSTFTLRLINEVPILKHLIPRADQRQSKISFDVGPSLPDHAPSVKSAGILGQLAGSRADHIVPDDVEIPNNSDTQLARERLSEAVKEFDAILKPGGSITYLGTPQTEASLYNELPSRGYAVRIWPSRLPTEEKIGKYGLKLAPFIHKMLKDGSRKPLDPVDPLRFDHEDLLERELSYGRSGFALQFQLDTTLSDAERYPLKLSDLIVMNLSPYKAPTEIIWAASPDLVIDEVPTIGLDGDKYYRPMWLSKDDWADYTGSVMFIDPSGRGKDETSYAVVKHLFGRLFITAAGGFKGGYDDVTLHKIKEIARTQQVNLVQVEPNFGGGMFASIFKAVCKAEKTEGKTEGNRLSTGSKVTPYRVTVEDAPWATQSKEARIIDTLEPIMNQHRLVVDQRLIDEDYRSTERDGYTPEEAQRYRLFYQMTRLTKERGALVQDDRLDALAGAVAYWLDQMATESRASAQEHRDDLLNRELEKFVKQVTESPLSRTLGIKAQGNDLRGGLGTLDNSLGRSGSPFKSGLKVLR